MPEFSRLLSRKLQISLASLVFSSGFSFENRVPIQCESRKQLGLDKDCEDPVCKSKADMLQRALDSSIFTSQKILIPKDVAESSTLECPVDKDELGVASWTLLHTLAAYYPENPNMGQQLHAKLFFSTLAQLYPCKHCAADFHEHIKAHPPITTSREALCLWVCELHNGVNEKIGKSIQPCNIASLDERWRYGAKGCYEDVNEEIDADKARSEKL